MIAETLSLDFVGNAAGLQDAVAASQRALAALNRDSARIGFGIGRVMRTIVAPIAGVILSAFAAKKALADFTQSGLPGVSRFNQAIGLMQISMFRLSSAVGEMLAPAAIRTANIIRSIADALEPIIRKITAAVPFLAQMLRQFGANILTAFRPLMPTLFGFIDSMMNGVRGIDWAAMWERLKQGFVTAWNAIIQFLAPVLVRVATMIDAVINSAGQILGALGAFLKDAFVSLAAVLGVDVQGTMDGLKNTVDMIQYGLIVTIAIVETAAKNWPLLFEIVRESASVAFNFITANWREIGSYIVEVLTVAAQNIRTIFASVFDGLAPTFQSLADNLQSVFVTVGSALGATFGQVFDRLHVQLGVAITNGVISGIQGSLRIVDQIPEPFRTLLLGPGSLIWSGEDMARGLEPLKNLGGLLTPEEIAKQFPIGFNMDPINFTPIKPPEWVKPLLKDLPGFQGTAADTKRLDELTQQMATIMANAVPGMVNGAFVGAGGLFDALAKNMANLLQQAQNAQPGPRLDRFEAIGPLLFGTSAAAARETNVGNKNPLVPIAQQQLALTREQLVQQRAAARAAERKARIANF